MDFCCIWWMWWLPSGDQNYGRTGSNVEKHSGSLTATRGAHTLVKNEMWLYGGETVQYKQKVWESEEMCMEDPRVEPDMERVESKQ